MCMNCAGHHRSLGTHISRVRSTTMDNWDAASVALMGSVGNQRANQFWENKLPPNQRINPTVDEGVRGDYIRAKYAQRAWYGTPDAGAVATASAGAMAQEPQEAKQLSKMEQRQMRLAQQAKAATPSPVSQPSASVRQTSTPLPAHTSNLRPAAAATVAAPQATLFSGMAPAPSAVAATAPLVTAAPVKAAPLREHSASPWVSKSEFQQPQPQQHFVPQQSYQPQHRQAPVAAAAMSAPTVNLLDLSSVSDTPAVHPAPGHAVDDMFSGLSLVDHSASNTTTSHVHPHVNTTAGGAGAGGSDLMSYYAANEPASAPARSQHPPQSSASPDIFGGIAPSSYGNHNAASSFSFIGGDISSSSGGVGAVGEDIGATSSSDSSSAFSFLGGSSADPPPPALDGSDFGALLALSLIHI